LETGEQILEFASLKHSEGLKA